MSEQGKHDLQGESKAKSDALRLLAARPRSVEELRGRLKLKKHPAEEIENVLETLKKQGLLDDEKFAKLMTVSKTLSRPVGRRQLEMDMKRKGISTRIIESTMSGLTDYDEKEAVRKLVESRAARMKGLPPEKRKARLFGFLKRRGFSSDAIYSVLKGLVSDDTFSKGDEHDES